MNLPDGTHLAYVVRHEAWYWNDTQNAAVLAQARPERPGISVMASTGGDVVAWMFVIEGRAGRLPVDALQLKMFDASWDAFVQIPEFFTGLAEVYAPTLQDVRELLDELGAVDETARQNPYEETRR